MSENILDITKEHCPMTFVKTKAALSKIQKGGKAFCTAGKGEPLDNVPKSAESQGYRVIEITNVKDNIYKVVIEK